MGLKDRVRGLERKARERGVNVGGPRLLIVCRCTPSLVRVARVRRCFAGSNNEIVKTCTREAKEDVDAFVARVSVEAAHACRHLPDAAIMIHFAVTQADADSFYAYD